MHHCTYIIMGIQKTYRVNSNLFKVFSYNLIPYTLTENEMLMHAIDSALFNLVLDDSDTEDPRELSKLFLHGDGTNR